MRRRRLGMVGGGQGAFIGAVHRIAARLDDQYELVAGALSADPARAHASGAAPRAGAQLCGLRRDGARRGRATSVGWPSGGRSGGLRATLSDIAEQIHARLQRRAPDPACLLVPGIHEGLRGMAFMAAAIASSRNGSMMTEVETTAS